MGNCTNAGSLFEPHNAKSPGRGWHPSFDDVQDDMQKMMKAAQLIMPQQLSGMTVYCDLGYNWRQEQ